MLEWPQSFVTFNNSDFKVTMHVLLLALQKLTDSFFYTFSRSCSFVKTVCQMILMKRLVVIMCRGTLLRQEHSKHIRMFTKQHTLLSQRHMCANSTLYWCMYAWLDLLFRVLMATCFDAGGLASLQNFPLYTFPNAPGQPRNLWYIIWGQKSQCWLLFESE